MSEVQGWSGRNLEPLYAHRATTMKAKILERDALLICIALIPKYLDVLKVLFSKRACY